MGQALGGEGERSTKAYCAYEKVETPTKLGFLFMGNKHLFLVLLLFKPGLILYVKDNKNVLLGK
jgi:hypothetical protein